MVVVLACVSRERLKITLCSAKLVNYDDDWLTQRNDRRCW